MSQRIAEAAETPRLVDCPACAGPNRRADCAYCSGAGRIASDLRTEFFAEVDAFCATRGIKRSTLANRSLNDTKALLRMERQMARDAERMAVVRTYMRGR